MHLLRPANKPLACSVARTTAGGRDLPVARARHDAGTGIAASTHSRISNYEVLLRPAYHTANQATRDARRMFYQTLGAILLAV